MRQGRRQGAVTEMTLQGSDLDVTDKSFYLNEASPRAVSAAALLLLSD